MHIALTRSTVERGVRRVAGMLAGKYIEATVPKPLPVTVPALVTWLSETHSRRADEDARRAMLCDVD